MNFKFLNKCKWLWVQNFAPWLFFELFYRFHIWQNSDGVWTLNLWLFSCLATYRFPLCPPSSSGPTKVHCDAKNKETKQMDQKKIPDKTDSLFYLNYSSATERKSYSWQRHHWKSPFCLQQISSTSFLWGMLHLNFLCVTDIPCLLVSCLFHWKYIYTIFHFLQDFLISFSCWFQTKIVLLNYKLSP